MERASVRRLPRPDRTVQTTLPAAAARIVRAEQSAAARVRIRLPVELQGSEFDCRRAQVMPSAIAKTCETTNTETHLPGNPSTSAVDSFRDAAAPGSLLCRPCRRSEERRVGKE